MKYKALPKNPGYVCLTYATVSAAINDLFSDNRFAVLLMFASFDTNNPLPSNMHYTPEGAFVKNGTFGQYNEPGYDSNGYPLQPGQYPDGTFDTGESSWLDDLGNAFDFSSWGDALSNAFDFSSWGDSSGGGLELAKGGAVSKEIDRLYKKYGGEI